MIFDTKFFVANRLPYIAHRDKTRPKMVMRNGKSVLSAAVLFALLASCAAIAQEQSSKVIPNSIWVGADGKFESDPDTALVQFGISAQQEKLQDATQQATQAAEQVRQLLRSNGIDPSAAQISRFATSPVYDYKNAKRKLVGYRVDANISLKVKDFSKIGPISEGLSNMEVTDTSITYQLDNIDAAKSKAVQDAMRRAHEIANAAAQAGGRGLGELSYLSVDTFEPQPIRPMMMKAQTAAGYASPAPATAEFSAEKITVTAHVNTLYSLK
jgi:uncharacterized protein YggE